MGVYIPNIEMPTSCSACPLATRFFDGEDVCSMLGTYVHDRDREDDCPLVPVPKHGRLIDADAFAAEMKKRQDACAAWRDDIKNGGGYGTELYYRADSFLGAMCETKLTLDKMPTIIPAEEGE